MSNLSDNAALNNIAEDVDALAAGAGNVTGAVGNFVDYTYYSGIDPVKNPSGNANVQTEKVGTTAGTDYVLEYSWDANDKMIRIERIA